MNSTRHSPTHLILFFLFTAHPVDDLSTSMDAIPCSPHSHFPPRFRLHRSRVAALPSSIPRPPASTLRAKRSKSSVILDYVASVPGNHEDHATPTGSSVFLIYGRHCPAPDLPHRSFSASPDTSSASPCERHPHSPRPPSFVAPLRRPVPSTFTPVAAVLATAPNNQPASSPRPWRDLRPPARAASAPTPRPTVLADIACRPRPHAASCCLASCYHSSPAAR
nr:lysine-rich arabinogalactan protein 18-like [Aegilops tauschii subsp. strangulata]